MKVTKFTLAILCLVFSVTSWAVELQKLEEGKKIQVFLFAGQSNMEGRADGRKLSEEDRERLAEAQERVQLAYNHEPRKPLDVVAPSAGIRKIYQRDQIFGPELFFGIALSEALPDEKFLFIKRTEGGTSLHGCWNPDWSEEKAALMEEGEDPKLYADFVGYVGEVLSGYERDEYEIRAMLWVQGESDSVNETAAREYGENLRNLVENARQDVGDPDLPFLLFQVGRGKVIEGMKRTEKEVESVTLLPQSQEEGSADFYQKMENGHYNYEGIKKLGQRFAEVFLSEYADPER